MRVGSDLLLGRQSQAAALRSRNQRKFLIAKAACRLNKDPGAIDKGPEIDPLNGLMGARPRWSVVDRRDVGGREDRRIHPVSDATLFGRPTDDGGCSVADGTRDAAVAVADEPRPIEENRDVGTLTALANHPANFLRDFRWRLAW